MKEIEIPKSYRYIPIFLSMRCNLNCSFCLNAFDKSFKRKDFEELSGKKWVTGLNKLKLSEEIPITLCGGEPSLHKDFIYIINNLKPELRIDILTNLWWDQKKVEKFISKVDPDRIKRDAPYPSIRVSYHSEQMGDSKKLLENVIKLQQNNFSIGIESVMYPSPKNLEAIEQMMTQCRNKKISFRVKSFTGRYSGKDDLKENFRITYGNYSRYNLSVFQEKTKKCMCKTSELLLGSDGSVYRCHRDLFAREFPIGHILDENFKVVEGYRECLKYGNCHPCDVKLKQNSNQELNHTSVKILKIQENKK